MSDVLILDLGYGNTRSVALAIARLGVAATLSCDADAVEAAARVVIPGVGAAGTAMERLRASGIDRVLRDRTGPTLGICLGMQLLFEKSEEDGGTAMLGLLPGKVASLKPLPGFPVPHMGWSALRDVSATLGIESGEYVYFAHSFVCPVGETTAATARYGDATVPAVVRSGAWWGTQFHPERSSTAGSRFLKAFLQA